MRPWKHALGVAGIIILLGFFASSQQNGQPRAGETVTPYLEWPIQWTAGTRGELGVRLFAQGPEAKRPRLLDFSAIPLGVSPVANIAFFCGDQPLSSIAVVLSHRC
jgi:hypothetical protein